MLELNCPKSAADRIVLDPRSVPRVPIPLESIVAHNRHQNAVSEAAQAAYERRRSHLDEKNFLRRLSSIPNSKQSLFGSAVLDSDDEDEVSAQPMPELTPTKQRIRGHSIFGGAFRLKLAPEMQTRPRAASDPMKPIGLSEPSSKLLPPHQVSHTALSGVNDPYQRMKLRCSILKSPLVIAPSHQRRFSYSEANTNSPEKHPSWHAHLRAEYRRHRADSLWRKERDRFMLGSRRRRLHAEAERRRSHPA